MLKMCGGAELRRTPWYTGAMSGVSAVSGVSHYTASSYFSFLKKVLDINF
jgi:hypothetical protein